MYQILQGRRGFLGNDIYTRLLLHMQGADGAVKCIDSSRGQHAVTFAGTAQIDTAQSKFLGSSLLLDGNSDYVYMGDHANWNFGSGAFCVESRVRMANLPADGSTFYIMSQVVDANNRWRLYIRNTGGVYSVEFALTVSGLTKAYANKSFSAVANTWHHVAALRTGNDWYAAADGTLGIADFSSSAMPDLVAALEIGGSSVIASRWFDGWIDEPRVSKGIARWTADFTPPTIPYR